MTLNFEVNEDCTEYVLPLGANRITITRHRNTGLWSINQNKGKNPALFSGSFTTFSKAESIVKQYLESREK